MAHAAGDLQENTRELQGSLAVGVSSASLGSQTFTVALSGDSQKTPRGHLATEEREKHLQERFLQHLTTFLFQRSPPSCLRPTLTRAGLVQDTKRSSQDPNQDKKSSFSRASSP